jgi:CHAT domain-containing protein/tetratricopeptide (TPR) repeat protein
MDDLLSLCAVARWFDRPLLRSLPGDAEGQLAALVASGDVEPLPGPAERFTLRGALRDELLRRLSEQPGAAISHHALLFELWLRRARGGEALAPEEAEEALHHLDRLFGLLKQRAEWRLILSHTSRARDTGPAGERWRRRLDLYEGYALVNLHSYERGEALLGGLLADPEAESELHLQALAGMAQSNWYQTTFDRALAYYQQLYELARETGDALHQGLALLNIGGAYNELHRFDQALAYGMRSLPIFRALGERLREAHALYQIGVNAMYLGRWELAREHFVQAIGLFETLGVTGSLAYLYWAEGYLSHMLGAERESERFYLRALGHLRAEGQPQPYLSQETLKDLGFLYQTQERWDEALACYGAAIETAASLQGEHRVSLIHYRRGTVFERLGRPDDALAAYQAAIAGVESLRGAAEDEETKLGLLGTTQQIYEATVLLLLRAGRHEEAFHYVERARSRAFLDLLAARDPELFQRLDAPVATLGEVRAALPAGALLLEYFTVGVVPRGEHLLNRIPPENTRLREHLTLPPQTWLFAVGHGILEVRRLDLDPNTIRPQPGDPGPGRRFLRERLLATLYDRLVRPAAHLLANHETLYLVPHGPLHYVPFMALRSAEGAPLLATGGPGLALAPSATVLVRNCLARAPRSAGGSVALGYNDAGVEALRYAEAEARHVSQLLGGAAWTGPAPKSARLIAEAPGLRHLHIAGHAVYSPHDPLASELRLGPDDSLSARAIIGGLRLETELVTLSACTSGLSYVVPGDELLGLQRAFLYAGAPAVVCTLWEAADLVTLLLMDRFYHDVLAGAPPAAALRDSQVWLRSLTGRELAATLDRWRREEPALAETLAELPDVPPEHADTLLYADPFYWAPFMLIGRAA